jgi:hypothetical protein
VQQPCFKSGCNNPNSTLNYQHTMPVSGTTFEADSTRTSASISALIFASVAVLLLL